MFIGVMTLAAVSNARRTKPDRRGSCCASSSAVATNSSGIFGVTFSPVHSRKLPHDPQNPSASPF
jgi:hypothetical protein